MSPEQSVNQFMIILFVLLGAMVVVALVFALQPSDPAVEDQPQPQRRVRKTASQEWADTNMMLIDRASKSMGIPTEQLGAMMADGRLTITDPKN